ncbi:flagellar basal body-associated protein FliL [Microbulbifer sp.]|uniref:flagellar basal body-associated protein FliL n=1 Tax=Microbulbifer sp. TaxID=1908541 RepID=UPI003F3D0E1D
MAETSSKSYRWLWLAIPTGILVTALVAINLYLLLGDRESDDGAAAVEEEREGALLPSGPPTFVKIDPFTVNLQGKPYSSRLLYVGLSLQVGNKETREFLLEHMPQVRSRLLLLHSAQSPEKLATPEGKRELVAGILAALSEPMAHPQPELLVEDVLFTEFIVQ